MLLQQSHSELALRVFERIFWIVGWIVSFVRDRVLIDDPLTQQVLSGVPNRFLENVSDRNIHMVLLERTVDFEWALPCLDDTIARPRCLISDSAAQVPSKH